MSRPEISYHLCKTSTRVRNATVTDVQQSTLAVETLSFVNGCDTAYFIANLVSDLIQVEKILIHAFTDNQSLHDSINTTKATTDRCLRVEISALREMYDKNEIMINWLKRHHQLNNVLTKKGTSYHSLIKVPQEGRTEF